MMFCQILGFRGGFTKCFMIVVFLVEAYNVEVMFVPSLQTSTLKFTILVNFKTLSKMLSSEIIVSFQRE